MRRTMTKRTGRMPIGAALDAGRGDTGDRLFYSSSVLVPSVA